MDNINPEFEASYYVDEDNAKITIYNIVEITEVKKYFSKDNGISWEETSESEITTQANSTGIYQVKLIDEAGNQTIQNAVKENEITAEMIKDNPSEYYGKIVTNYISQNGQSDWKIFYSNGTNIFLITGDYLENSKIDTAKTGMTTTETYIAYWASSLSTIQTISEETLNLFKATGYTLNNSYDNSKCISTLLNTDNWTSLKDSGNKAESVIGSPTVEMWMESWNQIYPNDKLYCNNTNGNGYYVGTSSSPTSYYIDSSTMSAKEGYKNKLYYPQTSSALDGCYGIWLASPSSNANTSVVGVCYDGLVGRPNYNYSALGVRPVVCLKSGISVR